MPPFSFDMNTLNIKLINGALDTSRFGNRNEQFLHVCRWLAIKHDQQLPDDDDVMYKLCAIRSFVNGEEFFDGWMDSSRRAMEICGLHTRMITLERHGWSACFIAHHDFSGGAPFPTSKREYEIMIEDATIAVELKLVEPWL